MIVGDGKLCATGSKQEKCTQIGYPVAACSNTAIQEHGVFTIITVWFLETMWPLIGKCNSFLIFEMK